MENKIKKGSGTVILAMFLLLVLISLAAGLWFYSALKQQTKVIASETTELQILAHSLAKNAGEAASGNAEAFKKLRQQRDSFNYLLQRLRQRDNQQRHLVFIPRLDPQQLQYLELAWLRNLRAIDLILEHRIEILGLQKSVTEKSTLPSLTQQGSEFFQPISRQKQLQRDLERAVDVIYYNSNMLDSEARGLFNAFNNKYLIDEVSSDSVALLALLAIVLVFWIGYRNNRYHRLLRARITEVERERKPAATVTTAEENLALSLVAEEQAQTVLAMNKDLAEQSSLLALNTAIQLAASREHQPNLEQLAQNLHQLATKMKDAVAAAEDLNTACLPQQPKQSIEG